MTEEDAAQGEREVDEPTALYRLYDADGALLYIGVTRNTTQRWSQHRKDKTWWHQVARRNITWFASRSDALLAESRAILAESPCVTEEG